MKFRRKSEKSAAIDSYRFIVQIEVPASADAAVITGPDGRNYPQLSDELFDALSEKIQDAVDTIVKELTAEWPLRSSVHSVPELIDFE